MVHLSRVSCRSLVSYIRWHNGAPMSPWRQLGLTHIECVLSGPPSLVEIVSEFLLVEITSVDNLRLAAERRGGRDGGVARHGARAAHAARGGWLLGHN